MVLVKERVMSVPIAMSVEEHLPGYECHIIVYYTRRLFTESVSEPWYTPARDTPMVTQLLLLDYTDAGRNTAAVYGDCYTPDVQRAYQISGAIAGYASTPRC